MTAPPKSAEYKQVTVLFADVVHSMDIAAAVGPERLREIMGELVERAAAVVQRFGGTVDKFTGDGIMAVFGAPVALEDHAFRACLAALGIQDEAKRVAAEVAHRDGIDLKLRVGLNSGQVIAGEIGSGALGYTAIGDQVGMAQRMESVAPPGGVMLSESTARLVEDAVVLAEPEMVHIKGASDPVPARRLIATTRDQHTRSDPKLVGRTWELNTIAAILDEAIAGAGCVIGVLGPPGIGKSRIVREAAATRRRPRRPGIHHLLRIAHQRHCLPCGDGPAARRRWVSKASTTRRRGPRLRTRIADADPEDLLLLDDLLGIADPDVETAQHRGRRPAAAADRAGQCRIVGPP